MTSRYAHVQLEAGDSDAGGGPGAGQPDEVAAADVAGEQGRSHLWGKGVSEKQGSADKTR